MSSPNRELILRHHDEIWSKGNLDAVDEIYAPDFVAHHPGAPDWVGSSGVKLVVQRVRTAFPDFRETVEDIVEEGNKIVTRFEASGTHTGPLGGVVPTGKTFRMAEIGIFQISGGQISEKWGVTDRLGMFQQLGVVPPAWPPMQFLYETTMDVRVHDLGPTPSGRRRIVGVEGGSFAGPRLRGRVLPGGGDWVLERLDGSRRLDVRITLETDDGETVYASYGGVFHAPVTVLDRLAKGEDVPEGDYYFRTAPLFETGSAKYGWLNHVLAVAFGRRSADQVGYSVYAIM